MVAKMMKWSPWPTMATRKFKVKVRPLKLELGFNTAGIEEEVNDDDEKNEKVVAIKMKWKGEPKFGLVPFHRISKQRKDFSKEKTVKKGEAATVEWDDEFDKVCSFTVVSGHDHKFGPCNVSFSLLYGEKTELSKGKLVVIGRVTLNIAEMAGKMMAMESLVEEIKLPINLHARAGVAGEANLLVQLNFVEVRDYGDSVGVAQNSVEPGGQGDVRVGNPDELSTFYSETSRVNELGSSMSSESQLESVKKMGFFSWKRRPLSFKQSSMIKGEPLDKKTNYDKINADPHSNGSSTVDSVTLDSKSKTEVAQPLSEAKCQGEGAWESKEVTSRDGQTKMKTNVFFASFDQRSDKAAGESACTALVAVIAHWLQLNRDAMPTRSEFDSLIVEGSSEWRKLCDNEAYTNEFPDKHFDLETVLHADVRPVEISRDDSFVGFFSPEKFEQLKEAMSFDDIWSGINKIRGDNDQRVFIVSWNDHFFVLKVESNAIYIIDTLGERLFEGCNQAYILKFDDSTLMYGKTTQEEDNKAENSGTKILNPNTEDEQIICSGKECCKEFIKRFLAAIPLRELEAEEKKGPVSYYSLHHRLQIELNFSYLLSSSLTSSPFSTLSDSASSSTD